MNTGGRAALLVGGIGTASLVSFVLVVVLAAGSQIQLTSNDTGTVGIGGQLKPGAVPAEYAGIIARAARTCPEITAPLLAAQIKQESGFNPQATSPVGAVGIAQFMPGTWRTVGVDGDGDGIADPRNPVDAITTQARYMCDQVAQVRRAGLGGDLVDLALAAYNAGFGAVQRFGGIPPFAETQNYVRRIRRLAAELAVPQPTVPTGNGGGWVTPVAGRCSSGFGARWGEFHKGQDLAAPIGTPIVAAASGSVIAAGPASGFGLWVKLQHPGGVVTIYGHINRYLVHVGQTVQAGQPIAEVGNRGQSTGPHLHYQVELDGKAVDPVAFHQQQGAAPLCG